MSKFGRRAGPGSPSFIAVARACTMSARNSAKSLHPSLKSERLSLLRRVSLAREHSPRIARRRAPAPRKAGVLDFGSGCGRETDSLLEGDGLRRLGKPRGRHEAPSV